MEKTEKMLKEMRTEERRPADVYSSVEFKLPDVGSNYLFRIRDISNNGMSLIVKKDSEVLTVLKPGDIIDMKYFPKKDTTSSITLKTEIIHISEDRHGRYEGHLLIGLRILSS